MAARCLRGREIAALPTDDSCFQKIGEWLQYCDEHHKCLDSTKLPVLPTRIVDVGCADGSSEPFLFISNGRRGRYAALSYCWGPAQTMVTTRQTLAQHMQRIELSALSRSLQDAILVTRRLGLRYVWIDALCIVQREPDLADFLVEALRMAPYYSNAYVTIAAGCSADSRAGFLPPRLPPPAAPCQLPCVHWRGDWSASVATVCLGDPRARFASPLTARAWTYQEAVLSARQLFYGAGQLHFECQRMFAGEDGEAEQIFWADEKSQRHIVYPLAQRRLTAAALAPGGANKHGVDENVLLMWTSIVTWYTLRSISNPSDRLTALAGVAQALYPYARCRYVWGLWSADMVRGLLWQGDALVWPSSVRPKPQSYIAPETQALRRAPSWSWACIDGAVKMNYLKRQALRYHDPSNRRAQVIRCCGIAIDGSGGDYDHHKGYGEDGASSKTALSTTLPTIEEECFDPLRAALSEKSERGRGSSAFELVVRGVLHRVRASALPQGDRQFSLRNTFPVAKFPPNRPLSNALLLRLVHAADCADHRGMPPTPTTPYSCPDIHDRIVPQQSSVPLGQSADSGLDDAAIVGVGLFDARSESLQDELLCLRLISTEGLLLKPYGDGSYRRVGFFHPSLKRLACFDEGGLPIEITIT
jgi:hypothetical protein